MTDDRLDIAGSLIAVIEEESALLQAGAWPPEIAALADAKARLIGALEAELAAEQRRDSEPSAADPKLCETLERLQRVAANNAEILARQIDLSQELLRDITAEAQRLSGTSRQTYRRSGQVARRDSTTPLAINTRL